MLKGFSTKRADLTSQRILFSLKKEKMDVLKGFSRKRGRADLTSQRILLGFLKLIPRRRGVLPDLHIGASG